MGRLHPGLYIQQLVRALGKPKTPSLPYLLPYTKELSSSEARRLSEVCSMRLKKNLPSDPQSIEETLFCHAVAGRTDHLFATAKYLRDNMELRLKATPAMYLLMLQGIARTRDKLYIASAVALYTELHEKEFAITPEDRNLAASLLLDIFRNCKDIALLLQLKIAYENYMTKSVSDKNLEVRYISTFIHVYLNTGQYTRAVELFENGYSDLTEVQFSPSRVLEIFPTKDVLVAMSQSGDVAMLTKWLGLVLDVDRSLVDYDTWSVFLSLGLSQNHHGLVMLIYSRLIMLELENVSLDDVMFSNKLEELESKSGVLASLSEKTLTEILHTLASNGDVNSTLSLIEWHYVHKKLKGEKALSKDLCLDIILSYCYHNDETPTVGDLSIQNVLSTLNNFTSKLDAEFTFSYRDICDAMSYRFMHYNAIDPNVEVAEIKARASFNKALEFEEGLESKPRKILNLNLYDSKQGNLLKNSEVLDSFIRSTINYILLENHHINTLQIFINCVLHHIMKYQNATGMVVALLAMYQIHPKMASEWLEPELWDIILRTVSKSPAAKLVGFEIYQHMKAQGIPLTASHYEDLILSASKGSDNGILQLYLHCAKSLELPDSIEQHLKAKNITLHESKLDNPTAYSEEEKTDRKRYYDMDKRDCGYLKAILNEDKTI